VTRKEREWSAGRAFLGTATTILLLLSLWGSLVEAHEATPDETYVSAVREVKTHLSLASQNLTLNTTSGVSHLYSAWEAYNTTLGTAGGPVAPESHSRIQRAFEGALVAAQGNEGVRFSVQSQFIKKGMLDLAWRVAWFHLTAQPDAHLAHAWYLILEDKFGWDPDDPAYQAMDAILQDHTKIEEERDSLKEAALGVFASKVREEVLEVEAFMTTDLDTARVKAAEALAYYYPLQEDLEARLGEEKKIVIEAWLQQLQVYALEGYLEGVRVARSSILSVLDEYQGIQGISEVSQMIQALSFALEEYKEGVSEEGSVVNQGELEEALTFLALAQDLWAQVRPRLEAIDPQRVATVDAGLQEAEDLMDTLAPPSQLEPVIQELVSTLEDLAGEEVTETLTPLDHLALMRSALSEALEAYKQGRVDEADRIVGTAYLEHFEPIEADLERVDPSMMEELETAIRVELRELIQQGASVDVVEAKIVDINQRLLQAEDALLQPAVVREIDVGLLAVLVVLMAAELLAILYLLARLRVFQEKLRGEGA
jgi:hypothetical protein